MDESNYSGNFLEQLVESEFRRRGFLVRNHADDKRNVDLFNPNRLIRGVPYRSIYGCKTRSEFVLVLDQLGRQIRIECRKQDSGGSVDEKFPYLLMNAKHAMPEKEIMILLAGNGARKRAVNWLKEEARVVKRKQIWVLTIDEFALWSRDLCKVVNGG